MSYKLYRQTLGCFFYVFLHLPLPDLSDSPGHSTELDHRGLHVSTAVHSPDSPHPRVFCLFLFNLHISHIRERFWSAQIDDISL
jgi:hypothetical protein